jgi:hypothetical protein
LISEEEEEKLIYGSLNTQLMIGVYPTEKYVKKIKKKYPNKNDFELPNKILEQDKNLIKASNQNFEKSQIINQQFDDYIKQGVECIDNIEKTFSSNVGNEDKNKTKELDSKVFDFKRETDSNDDKIKKINDSIPDLQRKKKENEEFFKKYVGEKKVWLDRLKEDKIRDETYKEGFKYLYEAKVIKLILEGILLEKVQDIVEKELCRRGDLYGWNIMNIQEIEKKKKEEDFEYNKRLIQLESKDILIQEQEHRDFRDKEDLKTQKQREEIMEEWKQIWREIWVPDVRLSIEEDRTNKRNFVVKVTMDVVFALFKKKFYDIFKLKNIILSNDEYIVMDKIRNYFPEKNAPNRSKDELVLNQLMNIIDNIKAEQEIIYCDLKPALKTIEEYKKNTESNNNSAIERLESIVRKITELQQKVNTREFPLVKTEVEEIRKLINEIPYEKERKLFLDNLTNSSRLYDTFLPLTNIIMVVVFMTVGKKRDKNYSNRIEEAKSEILKIKGRNNEISGKFNLLKELKEKLGEEDANDILEKSHEIGDNDAYKYQQIMDEIRNSLNKIIDLKNKQQMSSINFYKKLRKAIIRPKDIC